MRFLLDTNVLIPLEDSQLPLAPSLASFVRLARSNGHELLYHPASADDIREDRNPLRREQTLQRLAQYARLDFRPDCPWNSPATGKNDCRDNEILYALSLHAANGLVTEDRGIHDKAKLQSLADRVFTIQTADDLLRRLHQQVQVRLPNVEDIPLYRLTPIVQSRFFDSLRTGYPDFDAWFQRKAAEGTRAWITWDDARLLGGLCIYDRQDKEQITTEIALPGTALKLSTFKVSDTHRGRKVGELFLKAAFRYASENGLEHIFIHGDQDQHHFLFEMLVDFGFECVGRHPGGDGNDVVYLKQHPVTPPISDLPPFEYHRRYFPHFKGGSEVNKYVVPIRPGYHRILFPDYRSPGQSQTELFQPDNYAGNAIKMAYLSHAQTKSIPAGSVVLFYRSGDEQAVTSIGVVESYDTINDADDIVTRVKRRTVYSLEEIKRMAERPTRVMLFRFIRHVTHPVLLHELIRNRLLCAQPQSITRITHEVFERAVALGC